MFPPCHKNRHSYLPSMRRKTSGVYTTAAKIWLSDFSVAWNFPPSPQSGAPKLSLSTAASFAPISLIPFTLKKTPQWLDNGRQHTSY